jgi:hypothetical protein
LEPDYCTGIYADTSTLSGHGAGTPADPYRLCTAAQLQTVADDPSLWSSDFRLMRSLHLRDFVGVLGTSVAPFTGAFDGNHYSFVRLSQAVSGQPAAGLFGAVAGSIRHLTLVAPDVVGEDLVGAMVGHLLSGASLVNAHVVGGMLTSGGDVAGGLVGQNDGYIEWSSSTAYVANDTAVGASRLGGLVGSNSSSGSIVNSHSIGFVDRAGPTTGGMTGGLLGENTGLVQGSWSATNVTSTAPDTGGLIGTNSGIVLRSFARGHVGGTDRVGALVGSHSGNITDSYAQGNATGTQAVGGLVGYMPSGSVTRAYSSGTVTANAAPEGGFIGDGPGGTLVDCHYNAESNSALDAVGNNASAAGIAGNTTVELKQQATFTNWDFSATWGVKEDVGYPTLRGGQSSTFCTTETLLPTAPFVSGLATTPDGSSTNPYPICTAEQFASIVADSSLWSTDYVLMGDIDFGSLGTVDVWDMDFAGVFEGKTHVAAMFQAVVQ